MHGALYSRSRAKSLGAGRMIVHGDYYLFDAHAGCPTERMLLKKRLVGQKSN